ncbi:MAG: N-(5'-phosphoribosyl)anthranilate isomerase [Flavobacteriales bacterium]|nr:MAG: N-(5'-phosphoribosyl)anthranilate isomerase [Flavobacteriales bacterium]
MLLLKVCGMRDKNNISDLIKIQPDFIGLIFHEKSPRNVEIHTKTSIPSDIGTVGVFVNETEGFVLDKINEFDLKYIQLHGSESPHFCKNIKRLNRKVIKAFNIHPEFDFSELEEYTPYCDYFLFDAFGKNAGGNGITFDWNLLDNYKGDTPFFLSGGIDAEMAENLRTINHPMYKGVDVNSKFEIEPGLKNIEKIKLFKEKLDKR